MTKAFICGCASLKLSREEIEFFQTEKPWGLILFARNCDNPEQIKTLVSDFRTATGVPNAPVLIDQEGGRVQRLREPHWPSYPTGKQLSAAFANDDEEGLRVAKNIARLIATDLTELGINVDCLPVLDVPQPDGHDIIGDRAYGATPEMITALGKTMSEGLLEGGVLPVIKHIPGHGRATEDSHLGLPTVRASREELRSVDFPPFAALNKMPLGMTAHIVYTAFDERCTATQSPTIINDVIRGEIGFDGLLMTDDLSMKALGGSFTERAEKSIAAGCDLVLHCNGHMEEISAVAKGTPELSGESLQRAERAMDYLKPPLPFDQALAKSHLNSMMT